MRVSRWPTEGEDRISVRFDGYVVDRKHPPEAWKDLFDYPHLYGDGRGRGPHRTAQDGKIYHIPEYILTLFC
jgi:hypothetical protein